MRPAQEPERVYLVRMSWRESPKQAKRSLHRLFLSPRVARKWVPAGFYVHKDKPDFEFKLITYRAERPKEAACV